MPSDPSAPEDSSRLPHQRLVERSIPGIENASPEQLTRADGVGACPLREKEQGSGPIRPLRNLPALGVPDGFDQVRGAANPVLTSSVTSVGRVRERSDYGCRVRAAPLGE
jgi:hypothetical protein